MKNNNYLMINIKLKISCFMMVRRARIA